MIKVTLSTMTAERAPLPQELRGLTAETLRNLQTDLDPVPPSLIGMEFWPEVNTTPGYDDRSHRLGSETLTADPVTKTVDAAQPVIARSSNSVNRYCRKQLEVKTSTEFEKDFDIGGGIISNREELAKIRDLLDGTAPSRINFQSGDAVLNISQQNAVLQNIKDRGRFVQHKSHDVFVSIKNASSTTDKIAILDAELATDWEQV